MTDLYDLPRYESSTVGVIVRHGRLTRTDGREIKQTARFFDCPVCTKQFGTITALLQHGTKHHAETPRKSESVASEESSLFSNARRFHRVLKRRAERHKAERERSASRAAGMEQASRPRAPTITIDTSIVDPQPDVEERSIDKHHNPTSAHPMSVISTSGFDGMAPQQSILPESSRHGSCEANFPSTTLDGHDLPDSRILSKVTMPEMFYNSGVIVNDKDGLKPDEAKDFEVENNPFAFTPGQLNKMLAPKSLKASRVMSPILEARYALAGFLQVPKAISSRSTRKELPMLIKGSTIAAQHDTGAEGNIISKSLAQQLGLTIEPIQRGQGTFQLANGKVIQSIGRTGTKCTFALDKKVTVDCDFNVWDSVAGSGMIMGRAFLKATKTLSHFRHRLRDCVRSWQMPMLKEISAITTDPTTRLLCEVDGQNIHVNPDTGSDLDIMSGRYARQSNHNIDTSSRRLVQLGDGSIISTLGQVYNVKLSLGWRTFYKTFDVLPGIASDIILGETTLDELEAYTEHENSFADIDLGPRNYEMNIIVDLGQFEAIKKFRDWRATRKAKKEGVPSSPAGTGMNTITALPATELTPHQSLDMNDHKEICRRDEARHAIAALELSNPAAAVLLQTNEQEKQRIYEEERLKLLKTLQASTSSRGSSTIPSSVNVTVST